MPPVVIAGVALTTVAVVRIVTNSNDTSSVVVATPASQPLDLGASTTLRETLTKRVALSEVGGWIRTEYGGFDHVERVVDGVLNSSPYSRELVRLQVVANGLSTVERVRVESRIEGSVVRLDVTRTVTSVKVRSVRVDGRERALTGAETDRVRAALGM